uniref:NADH-ubiquinone oxidoreductase chain 4 n=1 Tax=Ocypode ceratophthalmus TaxID=373423 RepID=A0A090MJY2_OCYCE|nr:NADH dehydrogenase subunit 4 [Ocypode ceratophthalmus]QPZ51178.1 NADH dehydrogenase subunit 4 [Ocypode ceratophthalmus]CEG06209.1 NADH dehydrogenase subunit 4 [Ocypode ceratophthalmus]
MLKFILPIIVLMKFKDNWNLVQFGLGVLSGLVSLSCYHNMHMYMLGFSLGMDYVSYLMVYLSVWIMFLIIIASNKVKMDNKFSSMFLMTNLFLLLSLVITFSSLNYLLFYISFEASLIPTLILILGWGYQPERIQAGVYMLFYTMALSLPLLGSLIYMMNTECSLVFSLSKPLLYENYGYMVWYFSSVMAFLVKLPMYMTHLWLPKAHVEAPVAGSMILAGVLLKLGGYGLIRILIVFQKISMKFSWLWVSVSLLGGVVISLICLRQVDMKSLIAYSSVVHMSLVLCGLMIFSWWGLMGSVVVMVGHGLCSSGLFCLANMVYERVGSRSLLISKGLLSFMPSMGLWWFLLSVSNMAAPPSLNLFGEVSLIISLVSWSKFSMLGLMFLSFFSAAYTLYMYSLSQHGIFFNALYSCSSGSVREYLVLFLHWLPLNLLILNVNLMSGV